MAREGRFKGPIRLDVKPPKMAREICSALTLRMMRSREVKGRGGGGAKEAVRRRGVTCVRDRDMEAPSMALYFEYTFRMGGKWKCGGGGGEQTRLSGEGGA